MHHKLYTQGSEMFSTLAERKGDILTIARRDDVFVGSTRVIFTITMGTGVESRMLYRVQVNLYPNKL